MVSDPKKLVGQLHEENSQAFREVYSNFSRMMMTPWDFTTSFGVLSNNPMKPGATLEVAVKMSPHQFKAYAINLPLILKQWEKQFGEIKLPPGLLFTAEQLEEVAKSNFVDYTNPA